MPGIVGIVGSVNPDVGQRTLLAMLSTMSREPFYESGTCFAPEVGLSAGWVAHGHSYAARTCRSVAADGVRVLVAGECFGSHDGHAEALHAEYSRRGADFVRDLNGLFSGLVLDPARRLVWLFNDRYGSERIYVHQARDALYFASEAKALLSVLPATRSFDDRGVAEYLAFGCTVGTTTLFRGIGRLEPSTLWRHAPEGARRQRYFDPASWNAETDVSQPEFEARLATALREQIVPRYVQPGEAVGLSLTGGLDMRMIMAALPRSGQHVAYTFSGLEGLTADDRVAARVAAACGVEHHVLHLTEDFIADFGRHVDNTVVATDGCAGALGAHEITLNAKARALSPIRLTGNYGSEVLRRVSGFKPLGLRPEVLTTDTEQAVVEAVRRLSARRSSGVRFAALTEVPDRLFGTLAAARSQVTFRTPYLDNDVVALAARAPQAALTGPASSLRVIRALSLPLSAIPTDHGVSGSRGGAVYAFERFLARATFKLDYLYTEGLPARLSPLDHAAGLLSSLGVLGRHKYLPYRRWFRKELAAYLRTIFTDHQTARLPYLRPGRLPGLANDHIEGRRNNLREIDAVLTLEAIDRLLLRGSGRAAAPASTTI